jgi:hypothetical protein
MTHHWDEFSKSLVDKSVPRRESLRLFGAALAGALLSPLSARTAWAGADVCKTFCNRYPKAQRSACLATCQTCNGDTSRVCGSGGTFTCCEAGASCCHGYCTDVASDFDNCGACGAGCAYPGQYKDGACVDGRCFYWCVEGAADCGDGSCADLGNDPDNCGACGNVCPESAPYCSGGVCWDAGCGGADLMWDSNNCGRCGNVCPWGTACVWGVCEGGGGE